MSSAVREGITRNILAQQAALELAIERGNVALQFYIAARMVTLEKALTEADHE
jgi:hypothetical protein